MISQSSRSTAPRTEPELGDPELMAQLARGQLDALGKLYDRYQAPLRSFITRATGDSHDVDDLVHATFLAAAQSAERYDGRASCRPWLIGIAAQLLRRRRKTLARFVAVLAALKGTLDSTSDPRSALTARTDVERALARLSEAKRLTLLMAEVEGLTCPEIAQALAVPIGTVWTRLHAARRELRRALDTEAAANPIVRNIAAPAAGPESKRAPQRIGEPAIDRVAPPAVGAIAKRAREGGNP
jgi:RNA polymerase sigma-70 factor (ECF subfamily)